MKPEMSKLDSVQGLTKLILMNNHMISYVFPDICTVLFTS
jgi:hypothetical protein